jgi:hypothetical protein
MGGKIQLGLEDWELGEVYILEQSVWKNAN